jgi:hypothetical protein
MFIKVHAVLQPEEVCHVRASSIAAVERQSDGSRIRVSAVGYLDVVEPPHVVMEMIANAERVDR